LNPGRDHGDKPSRNTSGLNIAGNDEHIGAAPALDGDLWGIAGAEAVADLADLRGEQLAQEGDGDGIHALTRRSGETDTEIHLAEIGPGLVTRW